MIDDGIFLSYENGATYSKCIQNIRSKLCAWDARGFYVLKDRKKSVTAMTRYAVAIFDENNSADIDVLLMGNTLYVLAMRLAEQKWFITKNQMREFGGCAGSVLSTLDFESGYGALGLTTGYGGVRLTLDQCSTHTSAMKSFMLAGSNPSLDQIDACKQAFIYFAITIGEAVRFNSIERMMCHNGADPAGVLPLLQRWVIDSSVQNEKFPGIGIAVAGIHEKRGSKLFNDAYDRLRGDAFLSPSKSDLEGVDPIGGAAVTSFLDKTEKFSGISDKAWDAGYRVLLDAYFTDRLGRESLTKARKEFTRIAHKLSEKKKANANNFNGIKFI